MTMKRNSCETCRFFELNAPTQGACRRFPPVPFPSGPEQLTSAWPTVQTQAWCGEYALRIVVASEIPRQNVQ